jgi:hypothetical protein
MKIPQRINQKNSMQQDGKLHIKGWVRRLGFTFFKIPKGHRNGLFFLLFFCSLSFFFFLFSRARIMEYSQKSALLFLSFSIQFIRYERLSFNSCSCSCSLFYYSSSLFLVALCSLLLLLSTRPHPSSAKIPSNHP